VNAKVEKERRVREKRRTVGGCCINGEQWKFGGRTEVRGRVLGRERGVDWRGRGGLGSRDDKEGMEKIH